MDFPESRGPRRGCHLLRADLLPEAYLAPPELRELRELLRYHIGLTGLRTALKNRVHALLDRHARRDDAESR